MLCLPQIDWIGRRWKRERAYSAVISILNSPSRPELRFYPDCRTTVLYRPLHTREPYTAGYESGCSVSGSIPATMFVSKQPVGMLVIANAATGVIAACYGCYSICAASSTPLEVFARYRAPGFRKFLSTNSRTETDMHIANANLSAEVRMHTDICMGR